MTVKRKAPIKHRDQSILVKNDRMKSFYAPHHYHQDYEIIYIKKSSGIRVIGNNINNYSSGEVVILGPRLPHYHVVGDVDPNDDSPIETIAVLFPESLFDNNSNIPEFNSLSTIIEDIKYGIELKGECQVKVQQILEKMTLEASYLNFIALFQIMSILQTGRGKYKRLSSIKYDNLRLYDTRMKKTLDYISNNFQSSISVGATAQYAGMSLSGFSTTFKSQTGYTFSQYINLLRISKAAELLVTSHRGVAEVAYEVGYENLAYFNRKFKEIKQKTPRELLHELHTASF